MATQFELDCALMSGAAYYDSRSSQNRLPVPDGWFRVDRFPVAASDGSGFEAATFGDQNTIDASTEIVISFAGTDPASWSDWETNLEIATNHISEQLVQAVDYVLDIKEQNPDAEITFTGHSLGGGLASLMGVFFDCRTVTFIIRRGQSHLTFPTPDMPRRPPRVAQ